MVTQKSKLLFVCTLAFVMGCVEPELKRIKKLTGLDLQTKILKEKEINQWGDFKGDGHKLILYNITNQYMNEIIDSVSNRGFKQLNKTSETFSNTVLEPFIGNSDGFHKTQWLDNEIITIVIDTSRNKLIYYFEIM